MFWLTRRRFMLMAALLAPASAALSQGTAQVSLDAFVELSQRLLGRTKLDRDVAQIYLNALLSNAEDAVQLAYLVESNANPTPEMKSLASVIIEWWYTGVYTIKGEKRLATHTGALMWSALGKPAPGTCDGLFGAWSKPPASL